MALTSFELDLKEINLLLKKVQNAQRKLEIRINKTKPTEESTEVSRSLEVLRNHASYLNQLRQKIIKDMLNHEFLLWVNDEGPGYWG